MDVVPVVRHLIACEAIAVSEDGHRLSLTGVIHVIHPMKRDSYPLLLPTISLYALLAGGRGRHEFCVSVIRGLGPGEVETFRSRRFVRDLGADPLMIHALPIRLNNLLFESPGQYEFRLFCGEVQVANEPIDARDN